MVGFCLQKRDTIISRSYCTLAHLITVTGGIKMEKPKLYRKEYTFSVAVQPSGSYFSSCEDVTPRRIQCFTYVNTPYAVFDMVSLHSEENVPQLV